MKNGKNNILQRALIACGMLVLLVYFFPHPSVSHYKFEEGRPWNYAKLISGILRYGMPIERVIALVSSLSLDSDNINSWTSGVAKALKRYLPGYTSSPGDDE